MKKLLKKILKKAMGGAKGATIGILANLIANYATFGSPQIPNIAIGFAVGAVLGLLFLK